MEQRWGMNVQRMDMQALGVRSQERLNIEVTLLSTNKKSYMRRRLAQQRMTLSDLECTILSASRAISVLAGLLVFLVSGHVGLQFLSTL